MVITDDGMVVASLFVESMKEEMVAAVASRFVVATRQLVETLRFGRPSRFLLRTRQGLFSLVSTGRAFLAVVGNPTFNARDAQPALVASARKIGEVLKFSAPKER
jgi:predicted regulator of Ras-like GTPase activity (Roadblock/LC7/MglB family)